MVQGKLGKVITGASSHFVEGGGAVVGSSGVSAEVAEYESIGMETEDMEPDQRRAYLDNKYGPGTADSLERASVSNAEDPGAAGVTPVNGTSKGVGCGDYNSSTPDSTKISKYFTVADFSSGVYQPALRHTIPSGGNNGVNKADIICNLKFLATNSVDALKDWLSHNTDGIEFKIGSGFRNSTGTSDHNIGSACDLHMFKNGNRLSREELRQLAVKIITTAKIPYTQFLLEYSGSGSPGWIHFANRRSQQMSGLPLGYTMTGGTPYHPNLPKSA
jgi:hypothetical protein